MKLKYLLAASVVSLSAAAVMPSTAHAQSTGSLDFEESEIIVTGTRATDVGGVDIPATPKARVEIERELMLRQTPGQTVNDIINLVPGVSFTNNDPFGSLGGNFTIRGFGSDRISQTVDGIPLNDSGNYALYTNQQLDPETLESVTVSLGSTDVDSPTASAVGGTINIRTLIPRDEFGAMVSASYGDIVARGDPGSRPFHRIFGMIHTGDITGMGTKAWFSASRAVNESTFSNYGGVDKQQYNGRIYQELGANGDFISVSGHYNQNRNNFNGSPNNNANFSLEPEDRFYDLYDGTPCTTAPAVTGEADTPNSCGSPFERRYNPSNTGNIRGSSRFTLSDGLVLTVDPSYQYVKANGGGTSIGIEGSSSDGFSGVIFDNVPFVSSRGAVYYFAGGRDLNGDGDTLDAVRILSPSQTQTHRFGVITNLAYDISDDHRVRLAYTFDRARHRQTGQAGFLYPSGEPVDVFPVNDPILDAEGNQLNKRNRLSYATLHQVSGEYRGEFLDDDLVVLLGARVPFFERDLNQYCFTTSAGGFVDCVSPGDGAGYAAANPNAAAPTSRVLNYDKFLPNVGFTYNFTDAASVFASYAKNLSVPGTDVLYGSLYFDESDPAAQPVPETSDSFDVGVRYQTGIVQAQLSGWYTKYQNRLASAYSLECDCTVTRNLGEVEKYGIDGSISIQPIPELLAYVFGSYQDSEIKDDVLLDVDEIAPTAGKRESGVPEYTLGARVQASLGAFDIGAQVKRTGSRFLNDINTITLPGYTVADLDLRYSLADAGLERSYFQLNVINLFDEVYIGSAPTDLISESEFVNIGAPRTIVASLVVGF
ncbi:TonB-dependent receptor [Pelagerythrobacter rhizovicinus]|uniref:TonB-dependent receptor n=1 Tax=Pelagerythrobacter rhizovicinus TaxID=2268576 RepID=A0A4Q2KLJ1_9SPHN|nr:TonB-dependent receptor [Pelagerythrobacter rhizovicinus]RXZ64213.1 TonB-dependent receptor [Pelagerythrobacter rhizovicinus]